MRVKGYLEYLDLGVEEETGQKNIIVQSSSEFAALPESQQRHAWATISAASAILETTPQGIYHKIYRGRMPTKIVKKNSTDLQGLTLVRVYQSVKDRATRREDDQRRIVKSLKKSLKPATWLPPAQRVLIEVMVSTKLRNIERELFGKEAKIGNKEITEGNNGQHNK
jgi:hypothetical protein